MDKVRWGIISTARIGMKKVIPAMQEGKYCDITAISSRDFKRAEEAAGKLGIPNAYGSYEDLLDDPEIDAVYNPLPNHLHVEWSVKALEAGKHVLCEKPVGMDAEEAKELEAAARKYPDLKVMEAFMYRFHPQWRKTKELVDSGKIGDLRTINSFFSYFKLDPENIRNIAEMGGGGLMDIGCYCISLSRFLFDAEPKEILGRIELDPEMKVDRLTSGLMEFETGTSTFTCATQLVPYQRVNVYGTSGRIEIRIPFNAPPNKHTRIWHESNGNVNEIRFEPANQYMIQGDLFSEAVLNDTEVPTPLSDAVANMKAIDTLKKSDKEERLLIIK